MDWFRSDQSRVKEIPWLAKNCRPSKLRRDVLSAERNGLIADCRWRRKCFRFLASLASTCAQGRSVLLCLFRFWIGAPGGELLQRIAGTRRPWLAVGRDHFSFLVHFGPKFLGRLPELVRS